MKVKYKNNDYELKYSFRSMMLFENITHETFSVRTYTDTIVFFYCTLVTAAGDDTIDFDEFLMWLDDNPEYVKEFSDWIVANIEAQNRKMPKSEGPDNTGKSDGPAPEKEKKQKKGKDSKN